MITRPAPDLVYRRTSYRLAEPGREQGSSVRYVDGLVICDSGPHQIRPGTRGVRLPARGWRCVACAIGTNELIELEVR